MTGSEWTVTAEVVQWRGPSPYFFLPMGEEDSADFKAEAAGLQYWGQVAVIVAIGGTSFTTAVFPRGKQYLVPLRGSIRKALDIDEGAEVTARIRIDHERRGRTRGVGAYS